MIRSKRFEKGSAIDPLEGGWVAGHMIPERCLTGTSALEIKLWNYPEAINYGKKAFGGTEFVVIYGGKIRFWLGKDGQREFVDLDGEKHEYIAIAPGVIKEVEVLEFPAFGVTIRWPSAPGINQVISPPKEV